MSDHDRALAYARRLDTIEGWLRTLLDVIDQFGEDTPRAVHKVAGYSRSALDAPMLKVGGE